MFCHMINYLSMKIFWSTSSIPIVYQKYIWGRFRSRHINHRILLWQLMFIEIIMLQFLYQFTLPKSVKPCMKKCILSSIKNVVNVIIFYEIKRIQNYVCRIIPKLFLFWCELFLIALSGKDEILLFHLKYFVQIIHFRLYTFNQYQY